MTTRTTPLTAPTASLPSDRDRLVGRLAWAGAWAALVLGQLHALARHRTEEGASDLDLPATAVWAEPAGDLLAPLLDWGTPDLVYVTYGKVWAPLLVLMTLAAFTVHRHRRPVGFEKWAWRITLLAYVGGCASATAEYWTQWGQETTPLLDAVFVATLPFILLLVIGSTVLGVTLLVKRARPRASAVLLALTLPGLLVIPLVTSLGSMLLPVVFAFGWWGRALARTEA